MSDIYVQYPQSAGGSVTGSVTGAVYVVGPLDGAAASPNGGTIGSNTLYFQSASATNPGLVSSANQTFSGVKTFSQPIVLATNGSASAVDGQLFYDNVNLGLTFNNSIASTSLQIGQESWVRVRNTSGAAILNGRAVYISGAVTNGDLPLVNLAIATTSSTSQFIGVTTADIGNNAEGFVAQTGKVHSIDTSAYSPGQRVWLSTASAGFFQVTDPSPPFFSVFVGYVLDVGSTTGSLFLSGIRTGTIVPFVNPMKASGDLIVGSGSGTPARLVLGTAGQILTVSTGSFLPSWTTSASTGSNTGDVSFTIVGTTPATSGASVAAGQVITLQPANGTNAGVVSTTTQTFNGVKNFLNDINTTTKIIAQTHIVGSVTVICSTGNLGYAWTLPGLQGSSSFSVITNDGTGKSYWALKQDIVGSNTTDVTLTAFGSSPNANGASISGQALNLQPADGSNPGGVSTGTQVFAGAKTFSSVRATTVTAGSVSHSQTAAGAGYTVNWPAAQGGASTVPQNDGSGNLTWVSPSVTNTTASVSATYSALASDNLIILNSTSFTVTLRSPVGNPKSVTFKMNAPTSGNAVTIVSSQTALIGDMSSVLMKTYGDSVTFTSDGSNWYPSQWNIAVFARMQNTTGSTTTGILPNFSETVGGNTLGSFTAVADTFNGYKTGSANYVIQVSGLYQVQAEGQFSGAVIALANAVGFKIMGNGNGLYELQDQASANATVTVTAAYVGAFKVGDYISLQARNQATTPTLINPLWTITRMN